MGKKFSLLQRLNESNPPKEASLLPSGVEYQEYLLEVESKDQTIFIPLKECDAFEAAISRQPKYLTRDDLRDILRNHRGIKAQ